MEERNAKSTNKKAGKESRYRQLRCKKGIQGSATKMQEKDPETISNFARKDSGDYHAIKMQERIQGPEKRWRKEIQSPEIKKQESNPGSIKMQERDPDTIN